MLLNRWVEGGYGELSTPNVAVSLVGRSVTIGLDNIECLCIFCRCGAHQFHVKWDSQFFLAQVLPFLYMARGRAATRARAARWEKLSHSKFLLSPNAQCGKMHEKVAFICMHLMIWRGRCISDAFCPFRNRGVVPPRALACLPFVERGCYSVAFLPHVENSPTKVILYIHMDEILLHHGGN